MSWINNIPEAARTYVENNRLDEVECVIADLPGIARGKAVPARADDDHIIVAFGLGGAPGAFPSGVVAQRLTRDSKGRITFHGRIRWFETVHRYASEHSASGAVYRRIIVLLRHAANRALAGQERAAGQLGLFSCALHL